MLTAQFKKTRAHIESKRFLFLLLATLMVLILPALSRVGFIEELLFVISLSFLLIQSLLIAHVNQRTKRLITISIVCLIVISWLKPVGIESKFIDIIRFTSFAVFFSFIVYSLFRFIRESEQVNFDVLITSINIYLLIGIIGASLASLLSVIYEEAFNFPEYMATDRFVSFFYYSYITMSTVGYGDITPRIPQSQTLGYFLAITGQLYVAIIISFLVGKMLTSKKKGEI